MTEKDSIIKGLENEVVGTSNGEVTLIVEGDVPQIENEQHAYFLNLTLSELAVNCIANRTDDPDDKANQVTIKFEEGLIAVSDDYVYEDLDVLSERLAILEKKCTVKDFEDLDLETTKNHLGGAGVQWIANILDKVGGKLSYEEREGGIVAIIQLQKD